MTIELNGKKMDIEAGVTLTTLLRESEISEKTDGVAVAVNATVIPRRRWAELHLHEGDSIEVIHAVQGG